MSKRILTALVGLLASTAAFAETGATGNQMFPVAASDYKANPVVSLVGGSMTPKEGEAGSVIGAELSLDCPLFQPAKGQVRQQISYMLYDKNEVRVSYIELNPHWMTELTDGLSVGFGPGLGLVQASVTGGNSEAYLALGVGASASYRAEDLQFGVEYREPVSQPKTDVDLNNGRVLVKLGYVF